MIRFFKILLICTLCFHVLSARYEINSTHEELVKVYTLIGRLERQLPPTTANDQLKREVTSGLDVMNRNYMGQPHASQEFLDRLKN